MIASLKNSIVLITALVSSASPASSSVCLLQTYVDGLRRPQAVSSSFFCNGKKVNIDSLLNSLNLKADAELISITSKLATAIVSSGNYKIVNCGSSHSTSGMQCTFLEE